MAQTTVNFNLKTAGFVNYANQTLSFRLLTAGADKTDDTVVLPGVVTATSAADGTGSVALFRNGDSDIDSVFEVIFPNREKAKFVIPVSTSSIHLSDLLVDHVPSGSDTQQSSVYAAAIQRANHTGTQPLSTISDSSTVQLKPSEGAFANGDKTKLDGIEAGATADQTSEEIQDIVGGMLTGNTETGITVTYQDSDGTIDFVVASQTDENFTTADHSKLDGIEASADVTDTANVTSAGALMDSEVDADIKTLSLPASTTISTFAKTFLDDADAAAVKTTLGIDVAEISNFVPRSITFPTTSDFLSIADDNDLDVGTSDFTLSFWARLDGTGTEPILNKFSTAGYSLKFSSGSLILTIQGTGDPLAVTLATGLNDNKWHVYVVTVDRDGNAVAYVDNVAQTGAAVSTVQSSLDNSTAFRIGFDGANASSEIAFGNYVALHKSALTASQAAQIYFSADAALTAVVPTLMVDLREVTETFTDVSASPLPIVTNGTVRFNQDRLTEFTGTNVLATTTLGYTTGSGGTVTQASSKSTAVTLNKATGQITLNGAALAANTNVAFTLTNSTIEANDILVFNHVSGGTIGAYNFNAVASGGSAVVTVRNITSGSLTDAIVLSFAVIKAVTS